MEQLHYKQQLLTDTNGGTNAQQVKGIVSNFKTVMMDLLEFQRKELHKFRKIDGYDDDVIRTILDAIPVP